MVRQAVQRRLHLVVVGEVARAFHQVGQPLGVGFPFRQVELAQIRIGGGSAAVLVFGLADAHARLVALQPAELAGQVAILGARLAKRARLHQAVGVMQQELG